MTSPSWTPAERLAVAALLKAGLSAGRIGAKIGMTRNAVCGRLYRDRELHKLVSPPHVLRHPSPQPKRHPSPQPKCQAKPVATKPPQPKVVTKMLPAPVGDMALLPLAALGAHQCKWPVGYDPDVDGFHLFCGQGTLPEQVYCPAHQAIARPKREGN